MAALEKPTGDGEGRKSNIIRFGASLESSPLNAISIESFPFANSTNIAMILETDEFSVNPDIAVLDYENKATYKKIGVPSGNSSIDSPNPADAIAVLDIEIFEALRNERLLLVGPGGEYYLMYEYNGSPVEDLIKDIIALRKAYLIQSRKAMSINGLKAGVTTGKITNVESYLTSHHYDYAARKHNLLDSIGNITAGNYLEYRLDNLIPEES